jgi:Bacteriophage HK97-gp10, putative tail-component
MPNSVRWDGLEEFRRALRNLPDALAGEAVREAESSANAATFEIRSAYGAHRYTGRLQASVGVEEQQVPFGFRFVVRARAKHAHLFEFGTQARHYFTVRGVRKLVGAMPPARIFIPTMIKHRRQLYGRLVAMMQRHGLLVIGDVETNMPKAA